MIQFPQSLAAKALIVISAFAIGSIGGIYCGYQYHAGQVAEAETKKLAKAIEEQERLKGIAHEIGQALGFEAQARAKDRIEWERRLRNAKLVQGTCGGGLVPSADAFRLSGEYVRLWNSALYRGSAATHPPGVDDAAADAGAAPADTLTNHSENADRWADCRSRLAAWQQFARRAGWVK